MLFSLLLDFASDCVTNAVDMSIPLQTTLIVVFRLLDHVQIQKEIGNSDSLDELVHFVFQSREPQCDYDVLTLLHNATYIPFAVLGAGEL